jgi:two-component system, cell cycle sensor histidine kinase and response regulator CckA
METILVVDDEPEVLMLVAEVLEKEGYTVLRTGDPREALRWARTRSEPIHLLLTDVAMQLMNGSDLAEHMRSIRSDVRVLFMSGSTAQELSDYGVRRAFGEGLLVKPFSVTDLTSKVRAALDYRPPPSPPRAT